MPSVQVQNDQLVDVLRPYFYPNSDLDLWERLTTFHFGTPAGITDHFRDLANAAGWAWAGAPFAVPAGVAVADSVLQVSNMAGNRAFRYVTTITTNPKRASLALYGLTVSVRVGVRLDDGTDNNYVEATLRLSQAVPTQWTCRFYWRIGGGAVNTSDGDVMDAPLGYVVQLTPSVTPWTNWAADLHLFTTLGLGGVMIKAAASPPVSGLTWTPTRAGLVFDCTGGAAWEMMLVDWADMDVT